MKLTKAQWKVLDDLAYSAANGMRSRATLRTLSSLMDKGLIEYDPMAGTAKHTEAGLEALSQRQR